MHRQMKAWLVEALQADGRFSDIQVEQTWKGTLTKEWRRPDVRAVFEGVRIAFEVQLSTTFLDVIAARRNFYLAEGGLLFWVFAKFDMASLRMTEEDVLYSNNMNAFVLNERLAALSKQRGRLHFGCYWAEPEPSGEPGVLRKRVVSFDELSRDIARQRVYYFDFEGAREAQRAAADALRLRILWFFEYWPRRGKQERQREWEFLHAELLKHGVRTRQSLVWMDPIAKGLLSLKQGRCIGFSDRSKLVQVVDYCAKVQYLAWLLHGLRHYNRMVQVRDEDRHRRVERKLMELVQRYEAEPQWFRPQEHTRALIEFLLPELGKLPDRVDPSGFRSPRSGFSGLRGLRA